jgi:hypothetical protein
MARRGGSSRAELLWLEFGGLGGGGDAGLQGELRRPRIEGRLTVEKTSSPETKSGDGGGVLRKEEDARSGKTRGARRGLEMVSGFFRDK